MSGKPGGRPGGRPDPLKGMPLSPTAGERLIECVAFLSPQCGPGMAEAYYDWAELEYVVRFCLPEALTSRGVVYRSKRGTLLTESAALTHMNGVIRQYLDEREAV